MANHEIEYQTSTDYARLYNLLKSGKVLIGFSAIEINGVVSDTYSKVVQLSYNPKFESFDIGFTLFESDFSRTDFKDFCQSAKIRFIDLPSQSNN